MSLQRGATPANTLNLTRRAGPSTGESYDSALALAQEALDAGNCDAARELAESILESARTREDRHAQGSALLCLAHCERIDGNPRRACDHARDAVQLFELVGDIPAERSSLTLLAQMSMLLGRNDEAVESALMCVHLDQADPPSAMQCLAYNTLGIAYTWGGDYDRATVALQTSVRLASQCEPPLSPYQPVLNQFWTECARLVDERFRTGTLGHDGMGRLNRLAAACQRLQGSQPMPLDNRVPAIGETIRAVLETIRSTWQGAYSDAQGHLVIAQRSRSSCNVASWVDAAVCWAAGELAWARRAWEKAESAFSRMKSVAIEVGHERFACIAQELLAQVYEGQGKHVQARIELRELSIRERTIGRESLASRELVVHWRLGARRSERHLAQALAESRQFERWSLEDALTGIANRRSFELSLAQRLDDGARTSGTRTSLAVAMVDVDKFKSINDNYSHLVGDRVLKTLAGLMSACIRDRDVAARWAGDEFVILFDGVGVEAAEQVCSRIHEAIKAFDWQAIAPGLQVTVSVGLSEVAPEDSVESVLSRSDESMYSTKTLDDIARQT